MILAYEKNQLLIVRFVRFSFEKKKKKRKTISNTWPSSVNTFYKLESHLYIVSKKPFQGLII